MSSIPVRLGRSSYSIVSGSLGSLPARLRGLRPPVGRRALVVTHPLLWKIYGNKIARALARAGLSFRPAFIPEGEGSKNLGTVRDLYGRCLSAGLDRSGCVVAFGGGVVGDTAGFVAATYLRGVALVHVPTSLLAMVDSSIGGKTGVDLEEAKNFVGSFYQPRLVWIDPAFLGTLPERELRNGMAEVIKYGVIADRRLFATLERERSALASVRSALWPDIIARCAGIKARVVARDEKETRGLREILNFGHTWGHAIEAYTRYRSYKHGEAVAIGMCAAGRMAEALCLWDAEDAARLRDLIRAFGLPTRLKDRLPEKPALAVLARDKKNLGGKLRFVLPLGIGRAAVRAVPESLALEGLRSVQG